MYEESMATGKWYWLRGTEQLPQLGKAIPERGLGALVDGDRYPGGSVLKRYTHSFWFVIPGAAGSVSLYVCVAHIPLYRDDDVSQTERKLASDEISEGLTLFRGKGLLAVVGDLNSRTAMWRHSSESMWKRTTEILQRCRSFPVHREFIG